MCLGFFISPQFKCERSQARSRLQAGQRWCRSSCDGDRTQLAPSSQVISMTSFLGIWGHRSKYFSETELGVAVKHFLEVQGSFEVPAKVF